MKKILHHFTNRITSFGPVVALPVLVAVLFAVAGCGGGGKTKQEKFFTSGNREADQRAAQRMAKEQQIAGTNGKEKNQSESGSEKIPGRQSLFERIGGVAGISNIVADFLPRAMHDPRVNWARNGVTSGGWFSSKSVAWNATPQNTATLQSHMIEFLSLTTGGPTRYQGRNLKTVHKSMNITNAEFDAVIGDLKASLDNLHIADREQKELLAIIESTRPQIVTER